MSIARDDSDLAAGALLHDQLIKLLCDKLHLDVPSPDTDLIDEGLLDSLQFVQLVLHLEEDFGMHISLEDLGIDHFRSVVSIADLVANGGNATTSGVP